MMYEINNYDDYIEYLSRQIYQNGNMSDQAIYDFIDRNELKKRFGISFIDIKKDLRIINDGTVRKNVSSGTGNKAHRVSGTLATTISGGIAGKVSSSTHSEYSISRYNKLLSEWRKIKHRLTIDQLSKLYESNNLDRLGINLADVVADIKTELPDEQRIISSIPIKQYNRSVTKKSIDSFESYTNVLKKYIGHWQDRAFLDNNIMGLTHEYDFTGRTKDIVSDIRLDIVHINSGQNPVSPLARSYSSITINTNESSWVKFKDELERVTVKYYERLGRPDLFKGVLWDCFPENKKEINVLIHLLEFGIVDEIKTATLDAHILQTRYSSRLVDDYGIDETMARNITNLWCDICEKII